MTYGKVTKVVLILALSVLAIFPAAGCGDSAAPSGNSGEVETVVISARCAEVTPEKLAEIESGLTVAGGGSLKEGWAVKSEDFDSIYFIAAEMEGPGFYGDGQYGLWAVESMEPGQGEIYSVNSRAKALSEWPKADASINVKSDGAEDVLACIEAAQKS
jgi:hypothetical protein